MRGFFRRAGLLNYELDDDGLKAPDCRLLGSNLDMSQDYQECSKAPLVDDYLGVVLAFIKWGLSQSRNRESGSKPTSRKGGFESPPLVSASLAKMNTF